MEKNLIVHVLGCLPSVTFGAAALSPLSNRSSLPNMSEKYFSYAGTQFAVALRPLGTYSRNRERERGLC